MVTKTFKEYKPKKGKGKERHGCCAGSVDNMVREPISEKVVSECRSQRREGAGGISGGREGSGLAL